MARRERIENDASSTLNGAINNSTTTVVVTSGSPFPSEGDFRILIDSEIMLVTAVSGATFTVVRAQEGTLAASHDTGQAVIHLATRDGMQGLFRDNSDPFYNIRPPYRLLDSSGNTLTASSFGEYDPATLVTVDDWNGFVRMEYAQGQGSNWRTAAIHRSYTAPATLTLAFVWIGAHNGSFGPNFGPGFRESSSDKLMVGNFRPQEEYGECHPWNLSGTGFTSNFDTDTITSQSCVGAPIWMQIEDNNTNLYWRSANDGVNWVDLFNEPRTNHFDTAPDQWCLTFDNQSSHADGFLILVAWHEE